MSNRKEPTISGAALGEGSSRSTKTESRSDKYRTEPPGRSQPRQMQTRIVKKSSPLVYFLLLLLFGFSGFTFWQMLESKKTLDLANSRIQELEGLLELTGDESSASTAAIQAKLKWADSEIRKLWGVSYDTNRKAIASNKDLVSATSGNLKRVTKDVTELKTGLSEQIKKQSQGLISDVEVLNELVSANQASLSSVETVSNQLNTDYRSLSSKLEKVEKTLNVQAQDIEAINAFRRQVNQKLLNIPN